MLRRLLLLALTCGALLAVPASAFAHHADVTATVDCSGLVSYTVTSWQTNDGPDHRVNNSVGVDVNGIAQPSGAFNAANGYQFSGSYQLAAPLPASVTVTAHPGPFGSTGQYANSGTPTSGAQTVPPCPAQPPHPTATIGSVDCATGGTLVTLGNTGGQDATIRITKDGATFEDVVVAPGATVTRTVPVAEDTTALIALTSGGATIASSSVHADCVAPVIPPAVPAATIGDATCATGGATLTLTNTGGATVTLTVTANGTLVGTYDVLDGGNATPLVPLTEDAATTIIVSAAGAPVATRTLTLDCVAPPVTPPTTPPSVTPPTTPPTTPPATPVTPPTSANTTPPTMPDQTTVPSTGDTTVDAASTIPAATVTSADATPATTTAADVTAVDAAAATTTASGTELPFTGARAVPAIAMSGMVAVLLGSLLLMRRPRRREAVVAPRTTSAD
jgi:hypothetical protein